MPKIPHPSSPSEPPNPWMNSQRKFVLVGVVVLLALAYFVLQAFQGATVYYYTAAELRGAGPSLSGEPVRVMGKLDPGSFERVSGTSEAHFRVVDEDGDPLQAVYPGALPDLFFNEHSTLILHGTYQLDGPFTVERILVQCPSKYIEEEPASLA